MAFFAGGTTSQLAGISGTLLGGLTSLKGSSNSAAAARQAGSAAMGAAQFNAQLEGLTLKRRLDLMSRQINHVSATQRVQTATSGFAVASKSFMAVQDETLRQSERQILVERNASAQRQQSIIHEGQLAQVQAENRARAFEQQGKASMISTITRAASLLGGSFG